MGPDEGLDKQTFYDAADLAATGRWRDVARSPFALKVVESVLRRIHKRHFVGRRNTVEWVDVGCGLGGTYEVSRVLGFRYLGLDRAERHIAYCRERYPEGRFERVDWCDYRGECDLVSFISSLHHFEDWRGALARAFAALRPGGVVLVDHEPCRLYARLFRFYAVHLRRVDPEVVGQVEVHWLREPSILPRELPKGEIEYHFDYFPVLGRLRLRTRNRFLGHFFQAYRKVMRKGAELGWGPPPETRGDGLEAEP